MRKWPWLILACVSYLQAQYIPPPSLPLTGGSLAQGAAVTFSGTGGTLDNVVIGSGTPLAASFTTLGVSGATTLSGTVAHYGANTFSAELTGAGHRNTTANSGANLCGSATLSGTGWTGSGLGPYTHSSGVTALTASGCTALVAGQSYLVTWSMTAGGSASVTPGFGGLSGTGQTATGTYTYYATATSTAAVAFTPQTGFTGTVTLVTVVAQGPAFTSCGTTVVQQGSTDFAGRVTTGASGCVLTFQNAYTNTPACVFSPATLPTGYAYVSSATNTSVTFTAAGMTAFSYTCTGLNE